MVTEKCALPILMVCSSMAEQSAVNRWVVGSNPIRPVVVSWPLGVATDATKQDIVLYSAWKQKLIVRAFWLVRVRDSRSGYAVG